MVPHHNIFSGKTVTLQNSLLILIKDSILTEEYQYNENGSRIYEVNVARSITGRSLDYSNKDHLLTAGDVVYDYDLDGFLTTKTEDTDVTSYEYSSRGELLSVNFLDGSLVEFLHDPMGRRIAKKVNRENAIQRFCTRIDTERLPSYFDGVG